MVKKKTILKIALSFLGVLALLAAPLLVYALMFSWIFTSGDIPHKPDEELIANFQSHKAEFNKLLQMVNEDKDLKRVDYYWTAPENPQTIGVSQERIDEYRRLFNKADIPRGFAAFQSKDYIEFISSAQGLAVSGSSKSYVYSIERPSNVVDNLDTYRSPESKSSPTYPAYRHIEGNWYLCFEAD